MTHDAHTTHIIVAALRQIRNQQWSAMKARARTNDPAKLREIEQYLFQLSGERARAIAALRNHSCWLRDVPGAGHQIQ